MATHWTFYLSVLAGPRKRLETVTGGILKRMVFLKVSEIS